MIESEKSTNPLTFHNRKQIMMSAAKANTNERYRYNMIKNFAHRGFSGKYPENTLLAFKKACETPGCDGIELDVHLTKDGECVICHDETLDRVCNNATGYLKDYTLEELKAFDVSYVYREAYGPQQIPSLREYFELVKDYNIITNIELKTDENEYLGIEQKVIDLIEEYNMKEKVIISSFNHYTIQRIKALCPEMSCGLLSNTWILNPGEYTKRAGAEYYHPCHQSVNADMAVEMKENGIEINAWTADREEDIERLMELGVNAVISNYPDLVTKIRAKLFKGK